MPLVAEGDENTPPPGSGRSAVGRERNKNAQSARRAEARAATAEGREDKHLEAMHDASGATIRANSRRLATVGAGPEREVVKRDVEADIKRYVEFDVENRAACVQDYAKRANVPMLVCGSCGLRDPDEAIGMAAHGPVDLATISDQHWLHVGADALARMRAARTMRLLRVAPDTGEAERVDVRRELFHHFTEIDGKCYHVVPEAVHGHTQVHLCAHCRRRFNPAQPAERPTQRGGACARGGQGGTGAGAGVGEAALVLGAGDGGRQARAPHAAASDSTGAAASDRAAGSVEPPAVAPDDVLEQGEVVQYYDKQRGYVIDVTVQTVHRDAVPAYYTIRLGMGQQRETQRELLSREGEAPPPTARTGAPADASQQARAYVA
jgi:hypothetical protein